MLLYTFSLTLLLSASPQATGLVVSFSRGYKREAKRKLVALISDLSEFLKHDLETLVIFIVRYSAMHGALLR
ncbi:uncharacterized [Tachysurus ichikawai]